MRTITTLGGVEVNIRKENDPNGDIWISFEDGIELQLRRLTPDAPVFVNVWVNEANTDTMVISD